MLLLMFGDRYGIIVYVVDVRMAAGYVRNVCTGDELSLHLLDGLRKWSTGIKIVR